VVGGYVDPHTNGFYDYSGVMGSQAIKWNQVGAKNYTTSLWRLCLWKPIPLLWGYMAISLLWMDFIGVWGLSSLM